MQSLHCKSASIKFLLSVRLRFRKSVVEEVQELEMKNIDPSPTILQAARQR